MRPYYFVFDVESIGLHGEGFAVGWVVVDGLGKEVESGGLQCDPCMAGGTDDGREWVAANVPKLSLRSVPTPQLLRESFWDHWQRIKATWNAIAVTDCGWPVEARFLIDCVNDDASRTWEGPYPLHDLASVILAHGGDPTATTERLPNELPAHNPLNDARQSARILSELLLREPAATVVKDFGDRLLIQKRDADGQYSDVAEVTKTERQLCTEIRL